MNQPKIKLLVIKWGNKNENNVKVTVFKIKSNRPCNVTTSFKSKRLKITVNIPNRLQRAYLL